VARIPKAGETAAAPPLLRALERSLAERRVDLLAHGLEIDPHPAERGGVQHLLDGRAFADDPPNVRSHALDVQAELPQRPADSVRPRDEDGKTAT
jgi:hypothetical protein